MNDQKGGILIGNWSENFFNGTPPTAWSGSEAILVEYSQTKKPVKYAQCWVFGGVLTTSKHFARPSFCESLTIKLVTSNCTMGWEKWRCRNLHCYIKTIELFHPYAALRTLGIPARPITNFKSAHEVDANRAIDYYHDTKGNPMDTSYDAIWLVNAP